MFQAIVLTAVAVLIGLDQLTKWLAVTYLQGADPATLIGGVFELTYVENKGAAFGVLQGGRWLFIALTAVVMLALLFLILFGKFRRYRLFNISAVLIVAGGFGNFIDRLCKGYVVDFLHFFLKSIHFDFPVFNVADCCVVIGAILLLVFFCFVYDDKAEKPAVKEHEPSTDG